MSAFAEAFRVLRATILYGPGEQSRKLIAITSALPNEGKTTAALCLARTTAMSGEKVILLDCDLRRRGLNDLLSIAPEVGLVDVLNGRRTWTSVVRRDEASGAHILPSRPGDFLTKDVLGSEAMTRLLAELTDAYDMVLLDCAPVLAVAETRALARLSD